MSLTQNYFRLREFLIDPDMRQPDSVVPYHVCEKIITYHLPVLNRIRHQLGVKLMISKHSGYRPLEWEILKGRNGSSEHTFRGHGAVDLTCREDKRADLVHLLKESIYSRVIWYADRGFVHCDYKDASQGRRFFQVTGGAMREIPGART